MNDKLANDRTFLAWLRTGIALFGLGFVVAKAALIIRPDATRLSGRGVYSGVGVLIVLSGAGLIVVGYRQHASVLKTSNAATKAHGLGGRWRSRRSQP